MEIKTREILVSVIIVLVMFAAGIAIHNAIQRSATRTAEIYATATIIQDPKQFRYGMETSFGNALLYGSVTSGESVTFDEIGGGFLYIRKVREDYVQHTRKWTDSKGEKHEEPYWTWDYISSESRNVKQITFLECDFPYGLFDMPSYRLNLTEAGVSNSGNYIYRGLSTRYYYQVTQNGITGTLLANLRGGTMISKSALYGYQTPQEVIADKQGAGTWIAVVFWVLWVVVTGAVVYGFCYLENRWLD